MVELRVLPEPKMAPREEPFSKSRWQACLSPASFWFPERLVLSAWLEHAPFSFWLIQALQPRMVVELGTHSGFSYSTFCQGIDRLGLNAPCYAIDTWRGDEHAGFYGDHIFEQFRTYHDERFSRFSTLVRMTFDEAVSLFADASIDLLHIDGRHFYQDVRKDFESWKTKLSDRAVVLFHDTNVLEKEFGVFKLWAELRENYPSFEFIHGHGLGVLGVGKHLAPMIQPLFASAAVDEDRDKIRSAYARLGANVATAWLLTSRIEALEATVSQAKSAITEVKRQLADEKSSSAELKALIGDWNSAIAQRDEQISEQVRNASAQNAQLLDARSHAAQLNDRLKEVREELAKARRLLTNQTQSAPDTKRIHSEARMAFDKAHEELTKHSKALQDAYLQISRATSDAREQQGTLELMKKSICWCFTAPLRPIKHLLTLFLPRNGKST